MLRPLAVLSLFATAFPACIAADDAADDTELATDESEVITIGNACFNQWTTPQIVTNNIFYPMALNADGSKPVGYAPTAGRFERGGVVYMTGYQLNVRLLTDDCTFIKSVALGSTVLPKDTWSGEFYQTFASTTPPGFGQEAHDVFVHVTPRPAGQTDTLTITVGRDKGVVTATYSIPLVRVERIEPNGVNAPISITESEIQNLFARALYDAFDYGATNSLTFDGHRIYGYDPAKLWVWIGGTEQQVNFHFEFKADMPCTPTVKIDGRFRVNADENGISVVVPNNPSVTPMWPNAACTVIAWGFDSIVWEVSQRTAEAVATMITDAANQALAIDTEINPFLRGATMSPEVLSINLSLPVPSIQFRPAYDPSFAATSLRFPASDKIGLFAGGRGVRQYFTTPNNHWTIAGPNGVPKTGTPEAFWPGTHSLPRPSGTVWNGQPVGRLLARTMPDNIETVMHAYTPGCAVRVPPLAPRIAFGTNDTIGGSFQTDSRSVRALFLSVNSLFADAASLCEPSVPDIVIGP